MQNARELAKRTAPAPRISTAPEMCHALGGRRRDTPLFAAIGSATILGSLEDLQRGRRRLLPQARGAFIGFAGVDPHKGIDAVRELEHAVRDLGLKGLNL